MEEILEQIGTYCGDVEDQKHEVATLISAYLVKNYKWSFIVAAKNFGVNISNKMSKYTVVTMWAAAGIP